MSSTNKRYLYDQQLKYKQFMEREQKKAFLLKSQSEYRDALENGKGYSNSVYQIEENPQINRVPAFLQNQHRNDHHPNNHNTNYQGEKMVVDEGNQLPIQSQTRDPYQKPFDNESQPRYGSNQGINDQEMQQIFHDDPRQRGHEQHSEKIQQQQLDYQSQYAQQRVEQQQLRYDASGNLLKSYDPNQYQSQQANSQNNAHNVGNHRQVHEVEETVTLRFYCHHASIVDYHKFWIELAIGENEQKFQSEMTRTSLDKYTDVIFADVKMNLNSWHGKNLNYRYVMKDVLQSSTDIISRSYVQFKTQRVFFDTPRVFHHKIRDQYSEPNLQLYYSFILNSQYLGNKNHGNLYLLEQLLLFFKNCNYDSQRKLEHIFKHMQHLLTNQSCKEEFLKFCFQIVGFLNKSQPEVRKEASKSYAPLTKILNQINLIIHSRVEINYLRRDIESYAQSDLKELQLLVSGIQTLINVNPIFALNYISNTNIVPNYATILEIIEINFEDSSFETLQTLVDFQITISNNQQLKSNLALNVIRCARSLTDILHISETVLECLQTDRLIERFQKLKNDMYRNNMQAYQDWIYTHLDNLLQNRYLKPIFIEGIIQCILDSSQHPGFAKKHGNVLQNHPELINGAIILDFAQNAYEFKDFQQIQNQLITNVNSNNPICFRDFDCIMQCLFRNRLKNQTSIMMIVRSFIAQLDFHNIQVFMTKIDAFDETQLISNYCLLIQEYLYKLQLRDIVSQLDQYFPFISRDQSQGNMDHIKAFNAVLAKDISSKVTKVDGISRILQKLIDQRSNRLIEESALQLVQILLEQADSFYSQEEVIPLLKDEKFLTMICIGKQDKRLEMRQVKQSFEQMYNQLQEGNYTIQNVKQIFASSTLEQFKLALKMTVNGYRSQVIEDVQESIRNFKLETERYKNFQSKILEFNQFVDNEEYNEYLEAFSQKFEKVLINQRNNQRDKRFFTSLKSIDIDYDFKDSEIYNYLSKQFFSQGFIDQLKTQEVNKKQSLNQRLNLDISDIKLSVQQFDKIYYEQFIMKQLKEYINKLANYPDQQLNFNDLLCWINVKPENIQNEINIIANSYIFNDDQLNREFCHELIQHLQQFTKLDVVIEECKILSSIGFLGLYYKFQKSDKSFEIIDQFVQFYKQIKSKSLLEISDQLRKVSHLLSKIKETYKIDLSKLAQLKNSSELIEFCLKNENIDYGDLTEGLDDDTLLDNSILQDMVQINRFCNKLIQGMQEHNQKERIISTFLVYLQQIITEHEQADKNFRFNLQSCIKNIQNIKTFCDTQVNSQENTLKIVHQIMCDGEAELKIEGERCKFQIKYGQEKTIDNEKINQYSARAILLCHNRRQDDKNKDEGIKTAERFAKKVKIFQDIKKVITELSLNGHLDFQQLQYHQQYNIPESNCKFLRGELAELTTQLNSWKQFLHELRMKFYYLTMVPNSKLQDLSKYFLDPNEQSLENIESVFRFINPNIEVNQIMQEMPCINDEGDGNEATIEQCSKRLNQIFSENKCSTKQMFYDAELNELKKKVITPGKVQIYSVSSEIDNINAIASIFSVSQFYPSMPQLMFCNKKTKLYEVECFFMRAILSPQRIKEQRVFILSNFQKLQLQIQDDAVKFLEEMKMTAQTKNIQSYHLIIFQTVAENRNEFLIEQMQGKPSFTPFIVEEKFLKKFFDCPNVNLITSQRAGLGKSTYIKNELQKANCQYVNIPFQGELSKDKIIKMHQKKLQFKHGLLGLHYTINPSQGEDLNIILFELLIFKGINDYDNQIYLFKDHIVIYVEFSQNIRQGHEEKYFLNLVKNKEHLQWSLDRVLISKQPNSYAQIVLKAIRLINQEAFDWEYINNQDQIISDQEAQELLAEYYLNDINEPNFFMIDQFLAFSGDQLEQMKNSEFFSLAYFEAQFENQAVQFLTNFVEQMLLFSKNLCIMTKSMANQQLSINQNRVGELINVQGLNEVNWSLQDSAFVTFNNDGTVTPIFRRPQDLPLSIIRYYQILIQVMKQSRNNKTQIDEIEREVSSFEQLTQEQVIERIFKICGRDYKQFNQLNQNSVEWFEKFRLVFTADNFLKMNLIYLRLRSRQLVTIMGETGVGKTALIEYLKDVLCWDYRKLNIHEGVTEQQIKDFVQDANIKQNRRVILFFDEVNTNFNVCGLLKEIMVDRSLEGEKIKDHISIVAACNPYKLKIENQNQSKRKFTSGIKHYRVNQLADNVVYRVHPLPESVFPSVQDYGSLKLEEQQLYINKIIQRINKFTKVLYSDEMIQFISAIVYQSHAFIQSKSSVSSVSLRDVDRFRKLFRYFYLDNYARDFQENNVDEFEMMMRVLVLTMTVCYKLSLGSRELRKEYDDQILQVNVQGLHLRATQLKEYLQEEQNRYIDNMEIPLGIGKNDSLKENVFAIITMIRNKIPLFITGKPGSSKTLAMNLVLKSMRGKSSQSEFFKRFPAIQQVNYQGSIQSTSSGIERIFDRAHKSYDDHEKKWRKDKQKGPSVIIVVIIDEIGLAELSPHNPLKVLHAYLEMFKVGFVGISKWTLDNPKRNRGINLCKPEPNDDDLKQSADSQFYEICCRDKINKQYLQNNKKITSSIYIQFQQKILNKLVNFCSKYYNNQPVPNFHGLRDFYQLVCYISYKMKAQQNPYSAIAEGVQRNFGGQNIKDVMKLLKKEFDGQDEIQSYERLTSSHLISENMSDELSRNLMVISDNQETITLKWIEKICINNGRSFQVFYGSNFEKDKKEKAINRIINEIILCMESGKVVILLYFNYINHRLSNLFDQNYQIINGQKTCQVTFGSDNSRCVVDNAFKCILLINSKDVKSMDPSLLNRFEKHFYDDFSNLTEDQQLLVKKLSQQIAKNSKFEHFNASDMYPVLTFNDKQLRSSLTSLVLQAQDIEFQEDDHRDDQILNFCKKQIVSLANQSSVIRIRLTDEPQKQVLDEYYNQIECHTDVMNMLVKLKENWTENYDFNELDLGFNVMVYTFSIVTTSFKDYQKELGLCRQNILVDKIQSKNELEKQVAYFFDKDSQDENLILIADSSISNIQRINICKSVINEQRSNYKLQKDEIQKTTQGYSPVQKNVVFIVKVYGLCDAQITFGQGWKETFIDICDGLGNSSTHVAKLLEPKLYQILSSYTKQSCILYGCKTAIKNVKKQQRN
eukprot:403347649